MVNSNTYAKWQQELLKKIKSGIILLPVNDESLMSYTDNPYHFRPDSTFSYYFGLKRPGLLALMNAADGSVIIYGDNFVVENFVWMGKQPSIRELAAL